MKSPYRLLEPSTAAEAATTSSEASSSAVATATAVTHAGDVASGAVTALAASLTHGFPALLVAEGIETEEQYNAMKEIKISYIQGYYFSKPLPEEEFLDFLREKQPA